MEHEETRNDSNDAEIFDILEKLDDLQHGGSSDGIFCGAKIGDM